MRWMTIACSSRSLAECEQLLAEVVVDGRVGRAAGGARRGRRWGALAVAADEQLGRGGDERGLAAAGAEHEAGLERRAQDAEHGGGVVRRRRVDGDLARERDLFERAGADAFDRAGDRLVVVLGRRDGVDPEASGGRGSSSGSSLVAQARDALAHALGELLGDVVGRGEGGDGELTSPLRRASATSGTTARRRRSRSSGAPPPSGANAKPPTATRPAPAGPGAVGHRLAVQIAPGVGDGGEALGARGGEPPLRAERRHGQAVAVGLLKAEPVPVGPREANTTALGSTAGSSRTVSPTSTSPPWRRARRTARAQRAASAARSWNTPGRTARGCR